LLYLSSRVARGQEIASSSRKLRRITKLRSYSAPDDAVIILYLLTAAKCWPFVLFNRFTSQPVLGYDLISSIAILKDLNKKLQTDSRLAWNLANANARSIAKDIRCFPSLKVAKAGENSTRQRDVRSCIQSAGLVRSRRFSIK